MTEAAKAAKREYQRKYRAANREKLAAYQRKWSQDNPEKVREYTARYWAKKAAAVADQ